MESGSACIITRLPRRLADRRDASVIGAIVGELVDAEEGLGFLLQLGDFQYDTPMVFVAVFTLIALALALYGVVRLLEVRFLKWLN